jgi:hypothetical protein
VAAALGFTLYDSHEPEDRHSNVINLYERQPG